MDKSPTRLSLPARKNDHQEHEQSILHDIMVIFDKLSEGRLVERICRPCSLKSRLDLIDSFAKMLDELHQLLERIRTEMMDTNEANTKDTTAKGRSVEVGSTSSRFGEWKKGIKTIEGRYYEVLVEGSFKHYARVSRLLGINRPLDLIDAEEWAHECLRNKSKSQGCCD